MKTIKYILKLKNALLGAFRAKPQHIEWKVGCINVGGWYARIRANQLLENKPINSTLKLVLIEGDFYFKKEASGKIVQLKNETQRQRPSNPPGVPSA